MQKPKAADNMQDKIDRLRGLRLAHEAARKDAGTWGDQMVGEIAHDASGTVYVQIWKGRRRPDPLLGSSARAAGVPSLDLPALAAWLKSTGENGFSRRVVASDLSKAEAQRIKATRIAENSAAGLKVINPAEARP